MAMHTETKVEYVGLYNEKNDLNTYRRKRPVSLETNFLLTNVLHRVDKRCLGGWPMTSRAMRNSGPEMVNYIYSKSNSIQPPLSFIQRVTSVSLFVGCTIFLLKYQLIFITT